MPNYAGLKAAIQNPAYSGFTDDQIATAVNAVAPVIVDTPINGILGILLESGQWPNVVIRSETRPPDAGGAVLSAINAVSLAQAATGGGLSSVGTSQPTVAAALDQSLGILESVGDISAVSLAAIQALRHSTTSIAATLGFAQVTVSDIAAARLV